MKNCEIILILGMYLSKLFRFLETKSGISVDPSSDTKLVGRLKRFIKIVVTLIILDIVVIAYGVLMAFVSLTVISLVDVSNVIGQVSIFLCCGVVLMYVLYTFASRDYYKVTATKSE